jgi:SAM-dependent methyltransferase
MPNSVEQHYAREHLFQKILNRLREDGIENPNRKDLESFDEFHIRGAEVSTELIQDAEFDDTTLVLDVGCGIGGPARRIAEMFGSKVTGIDLTKEFIHTAQSLSDITGLSSLTTFLQADATDLPFEDNSFHVVWTQHVQMNIENKQKLYSEISRVLKKEGKFLYYDIFTTEKAEITYPLPWANDELLSFLMTTNELKSILEDIGMVRQSVKNQTAAGLDFFKKMFQGKAGGNEKIQLDLIMGEETKMKMKNLHDQIYNGLLELESGIYCKP